MKKILIPLFLSFIALLPFGHSMASLIGVNVNNTEQQTNKNDSPVTPLNSSFNIDNHASTNNKELISIIKKQNDVIDNLNVNQQKLAQEIQNIKSIERSTNFSDWVSILLACIAIIVTVLGVVIALISFIGYKNFKVSTKEAAEKISNDTATFVAKAEANKQINEVAKTELARLIDEGELTKHLESAVDVIIRRKNATDGVGGFNKYPEIDEEGDD